MDNVKPWQIGVIAGGLLIGVGSAVWNVMSADAPPLAGHVFMVDVTTGDLFEFKTTSKTTLIPEKNPDTGKYNLVPVEKDSSGKWILNLRYQDALTQIDGKPDALLSASTGELKLKDANPRRVSR